MNTRFLVACATLAVFCVWSWACVNPASSHEFRRISTATCRDRDDCLRHRARCSAVSEWTSGPRTLKRPASVGHPPGTSAVVAAQIAQGRCQVCHGRDEGSVVESYTSATHRKLWTSMKSLGIQPQATRASRTSRASANAARYRATNATVREVKRACPGCAVLTGWIFNGRPHSFNGLTPRAKNPIEVGLPIGRSARSRFIAHASPGSFCRSMTALGDAGGDRAGAAKVRSGSRLSKAILGRAPQSRPAEGRHRGKAGLGAMPEDGSPGGVPSGAGGR